MTRIIYLILILSSIAHADEAYIGYGVGVFGSADHYAGQTKAFETGHRSFLWDGIYWQNKIGYWGEGSPDKSRKSSLYIATGPGFEIDLQPLELRSGWGLSMISNRDSQLGGVFPQFNGDFYVGLRDKKGDGMGVKYQHFSSAGLVTPNAGRDFILLELSQKW